MKIFTKYYKRCRVCRVGSFKQNLKNIKYGLIGGTLHTLHQIKFIFDRQSLKKAVQ